MSKLQFLIEKTKKIIFFSCNLFFQFLVTKTLDHPDPYSLEMLDPDPQHWNLVIQLTLLCLLCLTSRVLQPTGIRYLEQ